MALISVRACSDDHARRNPDFLHSDHLPRRLFYLGLLGTRADAKFSQRPRAQVTPVGITIAVASHVREIFFGWTMSDLTPLPARTRRVFATLQNYDTM
jgi:hypothetical protein